MLPLSLAQRDFIFPLGNINASVRLKGELSPAALADALHFVIRRHDGLRMRLVDRDGHLSQRIAEPPPHYDLPVVSVQDYAAAEERLAVRLRHTVDLGSDGPLFAELLRIEPTDHVLVIAIHAAAIDAHGLALLLRELLTAYDAYSREQEPSLPPATGYTEYLLAEAQLGERLNEAQLRYWRPLLSGARDPIPRRSGTPARFAGALDYAVSSMRCAEVQRLQEFASATNVSVAATLYTIVLLSVVAHYSIADFAASVMHSGRDSARLNSLCAKTTRLFPLRMAVSRDTSVAQIAKNVQSAMICGALASRAPFSLERAAAEVVPKPFSAGCMRNDRHDAQNEIQLVIVDNLMAQPALPTTAPNLHAERVLVRSGPYRGLKADDSTMFKDALVLSVFRDPTLESRRPVVFLGAYYDEAVSCDDMRLLVLKMAVIGRLLCPENGQRTLGTLLSRVPPS